MVKVNLIKGDGTVVDITEIVGTFTIKGAMKECARVLDLSVLRPKIDNYLPSVEVSLGDTIEISDEGKDVFKGVVWERDVQDNSIEQNVTCYDKSIYLNKNEPAEQVFADMTPAEVTKKICAELGLSVGDLADGEGDSYNGRGMKAYDIIMHAYTKLSKKNNKKYKLVARGDKIEVFEDGKKHELVLEELSEALPGKLLNVSYRESMDELVNEVEVIEESEGDEAEVKEADAESQEQFGAIKKIIRGEPADIKGTLEKAKKMVEVECVGDWEMLTGVSVDLKSAIIEEEFYIISDAHEYNDGIHTAKLELSTEFEMDEREEAQQSQDKSLDDWGMSSAEFGEFGSFGGSTNGNIEQALAWAHKQIGAKYDQAYRDKPGWYDCSAFARDYGKKLGVLPEKYDWWTGSIPSSPYVREVPRSQLKRGDLLCWPGKHVEIYLGNGKIIHSTPPRLKVGNAHTSRNYRAFRFVGV